MAQEDNNFKLEIVRKLNGNFRYNRVFVCSGKCLVNTRLAIAFQPIQPEILSKWKSPHVSCLISRN